MTPFSKIYKLTMSLLNENKRIQGMDLDVKLDMFSDLIIMTSSADFNRCTKDLQKVIPYNQQTVSERLLIGMQSIDIELPSELIEYDDIIVMRNGEELTNVTTKIDKINNSITITWGDPILDDLEFEDDDEILVVFYKDGYFEEDLDEREKSILAYGVLLGLIGQEVNSEECIKANVSDKDYASTGRQQIYNNLLKKQEYFEKKLKEHLYNYNYGVATSYEDLM